MKRSHRRRGSTERSEREATVTLVFSSAAAGGVLLYDRFIDHFQVPSLVAVLAFGATFLLCIVISVFIQDRRSRKPTAEHVRTKSPKTFEIAVCSPFAAPAIRGFLLGRSTIDGKRVEVEICSPEALSASPCSWDVLVIYEGLLHDLPLPKAKLLVVLPEGHDATRDALFGGDRATRQDIIGRAQRRVSFTHGDRFEVAAVQGIRELTKVLPLDPRSQSDSVRRLATVIVVSGIVVALALGLWAVWFLAQLQ